MCSLIFCCDRSNFRNGALILGYTLRTLSWQEDTDCHCGSTMVSGAGGGSCSHHTAARKQGELCWDSPTFSIALGLVSPTFRVGYPLQFNLTWKHINRYIQRCISIVTLNLIKVTIRINHYSWAICPLNTENST